MNIQGFSKLSRAEKIDILTKHTGIAAWAFAPFMPADITMDRMLNDISENVISSYMLPFSVAPNFRINQKEYFVPMVTEESSVIAAASSAARFWNHKGGFVAKVISTVKVGQIHFLWTGNPEQLSTHFPEIRQKLTQAVDPLLHNMKKRAGGIVQIKLENFSKELANYFQIRIGFETADAMGANLINSCLEVMAAELLLYTNTMFRKEEGELEIIMAILSNHTPECLVECMVECPIEKLEGIAGDMMAKDFVRRFKTAVDIAQIDVYRATTHNKGIFNGIDAVVIATGNDFRAVEAAGHTYAATSGQYKGLSTVETDDTHFRFRMTVPLALGTVGGLTTVHPLAALSLKILGNPTARELMQIVAAAGLANHFSAIRALVTSGIQKGHMKLQLQNILHVLAASEIEKQGALLFFADKTVTYKAVQEFMEEQRKG